MNELKEISPNELIFKYKTPLYYITQCGGKEYHIKDIKFHERYRNPKNYPPDFISDDSLTFDKKPLLKRLNTKESFFKSISSKYSVERDRIHFSSEKCEVCFEGEKYGVFKVNSIFLTITKSQMRKITIEKLNLHAE